MITIFSSPELKAQVSFYDRLLSVVRLSVNFYIFDFFSRTTEPILTRLGTIHLWGEGIQVCSNEGDCSSPRGDNSKRVKIFKNFLLKLGKNYPWVKGSQVYSNKGLDPPQRGDNHKNVKMEWGHLKIFSITTEPILTKLGTIHPWVKGIQACSNEGDCPSPRKDNSKRVKIP
jgi:hypothetical protein